MFEALHKKTGGFFVAGDAWTPGLFENPHDETWIALKDNIKNSDEITEDVELEIVRWHLREGRPVRSFFRLKKEQRKDVILIEESEEHKLKKTILSLLLTYDAPISLEYDGNAYPLKILPIDRERLRTNIKTIEVTRYLYTHKGMIHKRADVLIPFIFSNYWGNGLVVEVKESEKNEYKEDKELFWFTIGYSFIWVEKQDFTKNGDTFIPTTNTFNVIPYSIGENILRRKFKREILSYTRESHENLEKIQRRMKFSEDRFKEYNFALIQKKNSVLNFLKKIEEERKTDKKIDLQEAIMAEGGFTNWELLFKTLRTNPSPGGNGSISGRGIVIDQERINQSTNSILQWATEIYPKVQSIQKIQEAQRNALKIEELLGLRGGLDAWL